MMIAYKEQAYRKMNEDQASNTHAPIEQPAPPSRMTLRKKGIWLLVLFVFFAIVTSLIIYRERTQLHNQVQQVQAVHMAEEAKLSLYMSITRAVLAVNEIASNSDNTNMNHRIIVEINAVLFGMEGLEVLSPAIAEDTLALKKNLTELSGPLDQTILSSVRNNLHKVFSDLADVSTMNIAQETYWLEQYFNTFNRLSIEWTFFSLIGIVTLSSLVMIFLTRLGFDIQRVQDRAKQIVEGFRGEQLTVTRHDELGSLMEGINKMQIELRQRETQIELSRQQQFHKEKMAAVGSLASAVAHEINNPMSAIVGLSQEMSELRTSNQCNGANGHCHPEMLVDQAKRVMEITRQISEFSSPQSAEPQLFDLNNLIRNTVMFVSFDRRFYSIHPVLSLDPQIPAIYGICDHITQVLINLLFNAADATKGKPDKPPRIEVSTKCDENDAVITITDNGLGIEPSLLARVFEEFFTTKPAGKGTGIGLSVSKKLIESSGGGISIESEPGAGTAVTIRFPIMTDLIHNAKVG